MATDDLYVGNLENERDPGDLNARDAVPQQARQRTWPKIGWRREGRLNSSENDQTDKKWTRSGRLIRRG